MTERRIIGTVPRGLLAYDPKLDVLWVLPDPKVAPDPAVASALALRNRASLEGVCPECGAVEVAGEGAILMAHDPDCPAGTERLQELVRRPHCNRSRRGRGGNK